MSSVLQRMAKRALGVLPSAEPLKASRYAPANLGTLATSRSGEAAFESEAFPEAEAAPTRQMTPRPPGPYFRGPSASTTPGVARDRAQETSADDSREAEAFPPPRTSRAEPAPRQVPDMMFGLLDHAPAVETNSVPAASPVREQRPALVAAPDRPRSKELPESVESEGQQKLAVAERAAFAREAASDSLSRHTARAEPATTAPLEAKTEIHISIGAIELRAPRAQGQPSPQPYRPRMSLDEFLSRKPGVSG